MLAHAIAIGAALFTHDRDLLRLAWEAAAHGNAHPCVVFLQEQKLGIGEIIRRLDRLARDAAAEQMMNRIVFL